jgi:hypothetical protein
LGIDYADMNGKHYGGKTFVFPNRPRSLQANRSVGIFSLGDGNEISLYHVGTDAKGENGKPAWSATLKCKAAK